VERSETTNPNPHPHKASQKKLRRCKLNAAEVSDRAVMTQNNSPNSTTWRKTHIFHKSHGKYIQHASALAA
jgi:hypothetical protein